MKAFIGRDFDEKYDSLVSKLVTHIKAHDIECVDAKRAKSQMVDEKVTALIQDCEIFIGVFTRDKPVLVNGGFWNHILRGKKTQYATSAWVTQESGFALGVGKELILLLENGVHDFPRLQGNMEYIAFEQDSIEQKFTQLSEMISHIKSKFAGAVAESTPDEGKRLDRGTSEEPEGESKEETKDEKDKALDKVWKALSKDKNYAEAQRLFNEEAEPLLDADEKVPMRAFVLRKSVSLGDKTAFEELQKLLEENKDNPRAITQLGYLYKASGEFEKGKEQFLLAKDKYDISDADQRGGLTAAYIEAARCLSLDNEHSDAINMLSKLLLDVDLIDQKAQILEALARISEDQGDIDTFFTHGEAALEIDPFDTKLRFDLAYAYSNNNNERLAFFHYKKLTDTTRHRVGLNNLGVSYERLKLPGKSVASYEEAAEIGEGLAMANLAHKYLAEGFVNDARTLIDEANKLSNRGTDADARLGRAQQTLKNLLEREHKEEKNFLLAAREESRYRVKYSKALCSDKPIQKNNIEGTWQTPWGEVPLSFDEKGNSILIDERTETMEVAALTALLTQQPAGNKRISKITHIKIEANMHNLAGHYRKDVEERTGSEGPVKHTGTTGYILVNESCNTIEVMEKTEDNKVRFEQWNKVVKPQRIEGISTPKKGADAHIDAHQES